MNSRPSTSNTKKLLATLAAGAFLFTACWNDPSSSEETNGGSATLEGQVTGEVSLAKRMAQTARGLEGAAVTVVRLKADGSFETVSKGEVKTDIEGRFSVESSVEAAHGLIVVAKKEGKEFKAVVSGEVKKGMKTLCRPLDVESSVEAEVYAKVQKDGKAALVSFAEIAAHVDGKVAAEAHGKVEATAFLAAQLESEAETRVKVLVEGAGKSTRAQVEKMDDARLKVQAGLEAALHAAAKTEAGLTAEVKAKAEDDKVKADWKAVTEAGIALGEFAKGREAGFRAMIKTHAAAELEANLKLVWLKRIALQNALALEAALAEDVKASGGEASLAAQAGANLKIALENAKTGIEVDSAFAKCRREAALGIKAAFDGVLGGKLGLGDSSRARSEFEISMKSATSALAVADAYAKFYADAEAEIKANLAATLEPAKLEALTRAAILVNVQGSVEGGKVQSGFSLSGSVEGSLEGAKIELAQVKPDGSIEIVAGADIEADAQGNFSIKTGTPLPDNAVIVVTKDSTRLTALVDATVDSVKVGTETTVETEILQKVLMDGKIDITPADVKAQVDSTVAASIKGNDSLMVSLLATLDAGAKAQAKFLTDGGLGLAQASLVLLTSARGSAQTRLEADLKAAAGESARIKAAYDSYHEAVMEAYVKAGLDASAYARSMQVYAQAMVKASVGLSMEAKAALLRSAHSQASRGLRSAVEIQMKAAGASEAVLKSAVEAGVALQAAVDASSKVETIHAAYDSYHAAILASLRGAFLLQASAISSLDGEIRKEDGARARLMSAIRAEAASEGISKAHVEFASQVDAEVSATFNGGLGAPSAAQVKVIGQVIMLANMSGG